MNVKELAKAIDALSLEDARKLVEELKLLGYEAPTPIFVTEKVENEEVKEKTTFDVKLQSIGGRKMELIKFWKGNSGMTLMEAKAFIETAPVTLKSGISKEEAEVLKKELEAMEADVVII